MNATERLGLYRLRYSFVDGAGQVAGGAVMNVAKNRTKGASMGPLPENPCRKGRATAMVDEKFRDSGNSR